MAEILVATGLLKYLNFRIHLGSAHVLLTVELSLKTEVPLRKVLAPPEAASSKASLRLVARCAGSGGAATASAKGGAPESGSSG